MSTCCCHVNPRPPFSLSLTPPVFLFVTPCPPFQPPFNSIYNQIKDGFTSESVVFEWVREWEFQTILLKIEPECHSYFHIDLKFESCNFPYMNVNIYYVGGIHWGRSLKIATVFRNIYSVQASTRRLASFLPVFKHPMLLWRPQRNEPKVAGSSVSEISVIQSHVKIWKYVKKI